MITTVNSDEIELLEEDPLRKMKVEHNIYQSFGSPQHLVKVAEITETDSGLVHTFGNNSGKKGGPLFTPEVDLIFKDLSKQEEASLINLLDIFSNSSTAIDLLEKSNCNSHVAHGNSFKIEFTDSTNPKNNLTWEKDIMMVRGGLLRRIADLMEGEIR